MSLLSEVAGWQLCCRPPAHPRTHIHLSLVTDIHLLFCARVFVSLKICCSPSFPLFFSSVLTIGASGCLSFFSISLYFHSVNHLNNFFSGACKHTYNSICLISLILTDKSTRTAFFYFDFLHSCDAFAFHVHAWQTRTHLNSSNHGVIYAACFPLSLYCLLSPCWFSIYRRVFSNSLSP